MHLFKYRIKFPSQIPSNLWILHLIEPWGDDFKDNSSMVFIVLNGDVFIIYFCIEKKWPLHVGAIITYYYYSLDPSECNPCFQHHFSKADNTHTHIFLFLSTIINEWCMGDAWLLAALLTRKCLAFGGCFVEDKPFRHSFIPAHIYSVLFTLYFLCSLPLNVKNDAVLLMMMMVMVTLRFHQ